MLGHRLLLRVCYNVMNAGNLASELPSASSERIMLFPQHSSSTGAMLETKQLMISKTEEYRDKCSQMPSKGFKTNPKDVYMVRKEYNF